MNIEISNHDNKTGMFGKIRMKLKNIILTL